MYKMKKNGKSMNSSVVGIDVGEEKSDACYLSPAGDVLDQFNFQMTDAGWNELASRIPRETRIAFEASGLAYVVSKKFAELGYLDVTVAHPKELAWITNSKRKNDRVDSIKIAKLHLVNMIPEAHLLSDEDRITRDLLVQRVRLGRSIGNAKNSITGYLKREGLYDKLPESSDKFSEKRRDAIRAISLNNPKDLVISSMMDRLDLYESQSVKFESEIRKRAKTNEDVRILMSIPGVDYYLAALISSYIGDVHKFPNADKLAVFFGVVHATKDSSSIKRRGPGSMEGSLEARWAL
ncbi:MAG: IS110 family transposase [Thermoplasmatales archaeon]|jgi:transposase|nr:IS110 family transposase [Candidatus Thermoplasmatota archaeon]MCL6002390.1 IS110 family transposase [Candidatus Thermoplasmatota archaeon]MDA8055879.1 IS110 family transposase [Thermoplasmatales archaeon]